MNKKYLKKRRGVSPVIAVLLLIAIAVATGILVYVWVTGLTGQLTTTGGQQVAEQLTMVSYDFSNSDDLTIYLKNTGTVNITIQKIYYDGTEILTPNTVLDVGSIKSFQITGLSEDRGTSHTVTVVTQSGAVFKFTVIAGRTG